MTDVRKLSGGAPTASEYLVQADGKSIVGDGTTAHPLSTGSGASAASKLLSFSALASNSNGTIGKFFAVTQTPTASVVENCPADGSVCVGLALNGAGNNEALDVQYTGPIQGTVAEWHNVTGEVSGLTPGATYYVDKNNNGKLTKTAPGSGDFQVVVGEALTTTLLLLNIEFPLSLP